MSLFAIVAPQDRNGDTNLIHAAKAGHKAIVDLLLKKHADVNMTGKERKTALYWAVEKNHVAVVKALLNADPNLEIVTKVTPLCYMIIIIIVYFASPIGDGFISLVWPGFRTETLLC